MPGTADTRAVIDALELMMRLRDELPPDSYGYDRLNAACQRLCDRFWSEAGKPRPRT